MRLGAFLNVTVLDHIIITESNGFYSYAESGNIREYKSSKILMQYDFEKSYEELLYNQIKEKIVQETKSNIAKEFIKTKTPVKRICEITGIQKNLLKQMKNELLDC